MPRRRTSTRRKPMPCLLISIRHGARRASPPTAPGPMSASCAHNSARRWPALNDPNASLGGTDNMTLTSTHIFRRVRLFALIILSVSAVVFYGACTKEPSTPTNQPPLTASNTSGAQQSSTAQETHDVAPVEFKTEREARAYIEKDLKETMEKEKRAEGHDDPIIVTDGSLHIKTAPTPDPNSASLEDDFDLGGNDTKLTRKGTSEVVKVWVLVHTDPNRDDPTEVYPYT